MIFVHYQIVCSENSTQQSEEVPLTTLPMGPLPVGPPSFWVIICLDWTHLDCWTFRPEKFSFKFELTEKSENLSTNKIIQDGQSCVVSTSINPSPLPQQLSKFFHRVEPSRAWYSLEQPSTAWYSLVQPGTAWYSLVQPGTAWNSLVQPSTARYSLVQPGTAWYSLVQPSKP